jgi:NadR type nicotinamide-nucleotide adenylyltransferase
MESEFRLKKVVITGPESTGKTTMSLRLANDLSACLIPEYARSYVENLRRPYKYQDLEIIAMHQIQQERESSARMGHGILLMDTWLIVTKIWFEVVYSRIPAWVDDYIANSIIDLFLVCAPDIPWIPDPVRENGGELRNELFERYCKEIEWFGFPYEIVSGTGEERYLNAVNQLKLHNI